MSVQPIPEGFHSVTPSLTMKDSRKACAFYEKAFGAKTLAMFPSLDGKGVMHAVVQIGDSMIMMGDEMPDPSCGRSAETMGGSPVSLFVYVPNVDEVFKQAVAAGGKETMPVMDQFWGDRCGMVLDPFGLSWMIATHKEDLTDEQVKKNAEAFFAKMAGGKK